ncbi:MAG: hypothetical protein R3237_04775 [Nitrosopumilaceae archaeon]|nr:hypothetical protein [Nitrosopumilaceae archaeon]
MVTPIKLVFSNFRYVILAITLFVSMLLGLLLLSEYIFYDPFVAGHIPKGTEFGFSLIVVLSGLSALVLPMNIYRINILQNSTKKIGGSVFGSFIGAAAGACSCGPIGFTIISTFGSVGATSLAFLTYYEIPIRLAAIGVLAITYFATVKSLKLECKLNSQN